MTACSCPGFRLSVVVMSSFDCLTSRGFRARYLGMSLRRITLLISSVAVPRFFTALIIRRNDKPRAITSMLHSHEVWSRLSTEKPSGTSTRLIWIKSLSSVLSTLLTQQWKIQGETWLLRHMKSPLHSCRPRAIHKVLDNVNCPTSAIKVNQITI